VVVSILLKCCRVILQLATEQTLASFKSLDAITRVLKVICLQAQGLQNSRNLPRADINIDRDGFMTKNIDLNFPEDRTGHTLTCLKLGLSLLKDYVTISGDGRILVLHNADCIECLFNLFQEENLRKQVVEQVLSLFRVKPCLSQIPLW
jgi:hypothetical protein